VLAGDRDPGWVQEGAQQLCGGVCAAEC